MKFVDPPHPSSGHYVYLGFLILGGGSHQHVPVDGGAHELALGHFGGDGQYNVLYLAGCILVQNEKLSLSRYHFIVRLPHHGSDLVTAETGAVDHILGLNLTRCCEDPLNFSLLCFNAGYLSSQLEFHPVGTGVFCIGLHQNERINDALPGDVQTALYLWIQVGLHFQ